MIFRSVDMHLNFLGTNGAGRVRCRSLIFISSVVIVYQWTVDFYFVTLIVTLDHKTSLKSLGYICSNSQKCIVWVKMIDFSFIPKIIRILSKDHIPCRYFVNFLL